MEHESTPEEIDQLRRQVDRLKMEEFALAKETDDASVERLDALRRTSPTRRRSCAGSSRAGSGRSTSCTARESCVASSTSSRSRPTSCCARATSQAASEINYGQIPTLEKQIAEVEKAEQADVEPLVGDEVGAEQIADVVEAWTGIPTGQMLQGETAKLLEMETVIGARLIGQRRRGQRGQRRRTTLACRDRRPQPAHRLVPLPRADRHRQDRAGQVAGRLPLRRRARDRAHRHERVRREALGLPSRRSPARLRRLRRGRPADRGRAPASLQRRAARRGREGPPGGLRHPAAGARRRSPHRRPGPHGRLPQHAADPDLQPGLQLPGRPDAGARGEERAGDGCRAGALQARVPQPARRDRHVRCPEQGRRWRTSSTCSSRCWRSDWRCAASASR